MKTYRVERNAQGVVLYRNGAPVLAVASATLEHYMDKGFISSQRDYAGLQTRLQREGLLPPVSRLMPA